MLTAEAALAAAHAYADELAAAHPDAVVAVVLIGSLATGDYVPGRSDIDTAVILDDGADDEARGLHLIEESSTDV